MDTYVYEFFTVRPYLVKFTVEEFVNQKGYRLVSVAPYSFNNETWYFISLEKKVA